MSAETRRQKTAGKTVVSTLGDGIRNGPMQRNNPYYSTYCPGTFKGKYYGFDVNGNCTWYAYCRFMEIQGKGANGVPPIELGPSGTNDAGKWRFRPTKCQTGTTPEAGAVAVFYDPNGAGPGHVMIVEEVYSDGSYWFTDSGYHYYLWQDGLTVKSDYGHGQVRSWMNGTGRSWYKNYRLWKFIYNPATHDGSINIDVPEDDSVDPSDYDDSQGANTPSGSFDYEKPNNKHIMLLHDGLL